MNNTAVSSFGSVVRWERHFIQLLTVYWDPSSGFDDAKRPKFNLDTDLDIIPTRKYPLVRAEEAMYPLLFYFGIIIFGKMAFFLTKSSSKDANSKSKPLINADLLYNLKFFYNICQIVLCSYMTMESVILAIRYNYWLYPLFECNPFNFMEPRVDKICWWFYISKIIDFTDTIFIILGNKRKQFTFLHIYHHVTIFIAFWININLAYDADGFLAVTLNSFVHTIMYLYYLISMHIPKDKDKGKGTKYKIWWKKYLTMIQMIQFILMVTQASLILFVHKCDQIPRRTVQLYLAYIISLFLLFRNFYNTAYSKKDDKDKKKNK